MPSVVRDRGLEVVHRDGVPPRTPARSRSSRTRSCLPRPRVHKRGDRTTRRFPPRCFPRQELRQDRVVHRPLARHLGLHEANYWRCDAARKPSACTKMPWLPFSSVPTATAVVCAPCAARWSPSTSGRALDDAIHTRRRGAGPHPAALTYVGRLRSKEASADPVAGAVNAHRASPSGVPRVRLRT